MAIYDNLGREFSSNLNLNDLRSLIATSMRKPVGKAVPFSNTAKQKENPLLKVSELLSKVTTNFNSELEEIKKIIQSVKDNKNKAPDAKPSPIQKEHAKSSKDLYKIFAKKGSGYTHDIYCEKLLQQILEELKKSVLDTTSTKRTKRKKATVAGSGGSGGGSDGGGGGTGGADGGDGGDDGKKKRRKKPFGEYVRYIDGQPVADDLAIMSNFVEATIKQLAELEKHLVGFNSLYLVFDGIVSKERQFIQDTRKLAYEVNTVTKESKLLNRTYEDIGQTVKQTGMDRDAFQESYIKSIKSGIKNLKIVNTLVKTQLNTENQLGLKAGDLNEEFKSWHMSGRMTNVQLADVGRGLRDIARNSGVTGDEFSSIVKSSESFVNSLKSASTLSTRATKNIIEIQANAKKLGSGNVLNPLLQGLTSSSNLLMEASGQTQALLFSAASKVGKIDELLNGTLTNSKEGIASLAKGIDGVLKGFGVSSMDAIDQLSDSAKRQLNLSLKATFGLELGDLRATYNTLLESSKTFSDRLKDINAQRQNNLTLEEKKNLLEEERRLKTNKSLEILAVIDEAAKGAKDMNSALVTFGKRKDEFSNDLQSMGLAAAATNSDIIKYALEDSIKNVNMGLKQANKQELNINSKSIEEALKNPQYLRELTEIISKGEQELAVAQKSQLNPMDSMAQSLNEINDNIRKYTNSTVSKLFNSVIGKIIALTSAVVGVGGGIALLYYGFKRKMDTIRRMFSDEETGILGRIFGNTPKPDPSSATKMATEKIKFSETPVVKDFMKFYDDISIRMSEGFDSFAKGISETTEKWADNITSKTSKFVSEVAADPLDAYKNLIKNFWDKTTTTVKTFWQTTSDFASKKYSKIQTIISDVTESVSKDIASKSGLVGKLVDFGSKTKHAMKDLPGLGARLLNSSKMFGTNLLNSSKMFAKNIPSLFAKGVGKGLEVFTRASGATVSGLFKIASSMSPLSLALTGMFIAVDGLTGSMNAFSRAGETFNKALEDVTLNEEYSAKVSGMLFGILNGLTLGIAGLILPLDSWADSLARFNAKIPILTILLSPVVVALEATWGLIKGIGLMIWEVIKGIYNGIANIIMPIFEGLSDIVSAIGSIFGGTSDKASDLIKRFRELGGVVGIISGPIKFIGTAIGSIFEYFGKAVGFIIKTVFKLIEGFTVIFKPVKEAFEAVWVGIKDIFIAVTDIVLLAYDAIKLVFTSIAGIIGSVLSIFSGGETKGFFETVKSIGMVLGEITSFFIKGLLWPLKMVGSILSAVGKTIQAFTKILRGDFSAASELVSSAMKGILNSILWPFNGIIKFIASIGGGTLNALTSIMTSIFNIITYPFKLILNIFSGVISTVQNGVGAFVGALSDIFDPFKETFQYLKASFVEVWKGIVDVKNLIFDIFKSISSVIYEVFNPVFSFFSGDGKLFVEIMKTIGKNLSGLIKLVFKVLLTPIKILGAVIGSVGRTIQAVVKVLRGDFSGALNLIIENVKQIFSAITSPFTAIVTFIKDTFNNAKNLFSYLPNFIKSIFYGIMNGIQFIYDSITGVFSSLIENVKNLGIAIYDTLSSAFSNLVNYVLDLIPGGGVAKWLLGMEEKKKPDAAQQANLAAINRFKEGTNKIDKNGLAYLHKNEIVIPSNDISKLSAVGNGPFNSKEISSTILNNVSNNNLNNTVKSVFEKESIISNNEKIPAIRNIGRNSDSNIHDTVRIDKASKKAEITEVVSSDLGEINGESKEHTLLLNALIKEVSLLREQLNPTSSPNRGKSDFSTDTLPNEVTHKPANYYRNNVGLVSQTPFKSALNLGPQNT